MVLSHWNHPRKQTRRQNIWENVQENKGHPKIGLVVNKFDVCVQYHRLLAKVCGLMLARVCVCVCVCVRACVCVCVACVFVFRRISKIYFVDNSSIP